MDFKKSIMILVSLLMAMIITLSSCGNTSASNAQESDAGNDAGAETATTLTEYDAPSKAEMFTDRDLSGDYDESTAVSIELSGTSAKASSDKGVSIDGSTVTISAEGVYIVSGTLSDGQIIVEADDTAKVQIVLKDASITSKTSAAIYVKSADKVFVTSAEGTKNTLANGGSFTAIDDSNIDGAVFAKDDITFNGSGSITVESPAGHGIVGKDDVKLAGGTITINSARHGVQANDSIRVADAAVTIDAGKEGMESLLIYICGGDIKIAAADDGINAANSDNQSMDGGTDGEILIEGGKIYITANGDGIDSNGSVTISGGYTVVCGPSQGDTSVLDINSTATITGGTFIGTGGAGMGENFTSAENQALISVSVGSQSAGSAVTLKDESGNTVTEVTPDLDYNVVFVSTPDVQQGGTYTLEAGSYSETISISEAIYSTMQGGMGGGMQGGKGGGMHGGPNGDMQGGKHGPMNDDNQ